jgi:hypothetical protein
VKSIFEVSVWPLLLLLAAAAPPPHHRLQHAPHHPAAHRPLKHKPAKPTAKVAAPAAPVEEIEAVEPIEAAEAVGAVGAPAKEQAADDDAISNRPRSLREWVSRLHAAAVHLPLAWTLLLWLVEVGAWGLGLMAWRFPGFCLQALTLLSFAPAILSGLWRFDSLPHADAASAAPGLLHRNLMFACAATLAVDLALRRLWQSSDGRSGRLLHLALLSLAAGQVAYGGHLGGALVYGDDFLSWGGFHLF